MAKTVARPDDLVDEELSTVAFVRDYLEFHFDGPVLRALTLVRIFDRAGALVAVQNVGDWRDQLCAFIGQAVRDVAVSDNHSITLFFAEGRQLVVPLDAASRIGPEAAHFISAPNHGLSVW